MLNIFSILSKIFKIFPTKLKLMFYFVIFLMLITMLLEAISLGLIFPIISIFSNESFMSFDFNIFDFDFGNFLLNI